MSCPAAIFIWVKGWSQTLKSKATILFHFTLAENHVTKFDFDFDWYRLENQRAALMILPEWSSEQRQDGSLHCLRGILRDSAAVKQAGITLPWTGHADRLQYDYSCLWKVYEHWPILYIAVHLRIKITNKIYVHLIWQKPSLLNTTMILISKVCSLWQLWEHLQYSDVGWLT